MSNIDELLIKSECDKRDYRFIQLDNGLKAVLIADYEEPCNDSKGGRKRKYSEVESSISSSEDEDADSDLETAFCGKLAACALTVSVGSLSDPPEIQGLAHFVEHMLFMGSEKYPKENALDEFLQKHCGSNNAETDYETSTFYLECDPNVIGEAVDIFANFFISPLMLKDAMIRERQAVDAEFQMSVTSDDYRLEQLLGSLAPEGHPMRKFSWGNLKTLSESISDEELYKAAHEFRKRHYSAHRMTVAIIACMDLDSLEEIARNSFSDVPCNSLPPIDFSPHSGTFDKADFHSLLYVKPINDIFDVTVTWVMPSLLYEYKSKPISILGWCFEHEGAGSLCSYLREKVWIGDLTAGNDYSQSDHNSLHSFFYVNLALTDQGFQNISLILNEVFSYIAMLREQLPFDRLYEEQKEISENAFRFKYDSEPTPYAEELSQNLHIREPHLLLAGNLFLEYRPDLIKKILESMRHDNVNVLVRSKNFENTFYDSIEPYFDTKYKIEKIPSEWIDNWAKASPKEAYHLPLPNPYLGNDFSMLPPPADQLEYPAKVFEDDLMKIWHLQDTTFKRPFSLFNIYITSPILLNSALNVVHTHLLLSYLDRKLISLRNPAAYANYNCDFSYDQIGLIMIFRGYSSKMVFFYNQVLEAITKYCGSISDTKNFEIFESVKKDTAREFRNSLNETATLSQAIRLSILVKNCFTNLDALNALSQVSQESLQSFANELFSQFQIQILTEGNVSVEIAIDIGQTIRNYFGRQPCKKEKIQVIQLPLGETYCRAYSLNNQDKNALLVNYYQIDRLSLRTTCLIELLLELLNEPLFNILRTQKQLGYYVEATIKDTYDIMGMAVEISYVETSWSADKVDRIVDEFLADFLQTLREMPEDDFEQAKVEYINFKNIKDLSLSTQAHRNFSEISSDRFMFDRKKREAAECIGISKDDLCEWMERCIVKGGSDVKKLSVQVIPAETLVCDPISLKFLEVAEKKFISDPQLFKNCCQTYKLS